MDFIDADSSQEERPAAIADRTLRIIAEHGFFALPGSLSYARSACAELLFARAMIEAQTARIAQLESAVSKSLAA